MIILPKPSWKISQRRTRFHWLMKKLSPTSKKKRKLCPARFLNQPISVLGLSPLSNTAVLVLLKHPRSPFTSPAFSTIFYSYSFNSICHNQRNFLFIISTFFFFFFFFTKFTIYQGTAVFRLAYQVRVNCNPP